jgi:glycolate oxidase FAD binding subunit
MTVTVQAGCSITRFQQVLAAQNQRLALDPLWPDTSTIGGILATNDSGSLRIRFGSLRDSIIGITIALPDGTIARSGGKVVKNVAGYDLPKLMTGALGTLGMIVDATFRLYPQPQSTATVTMQAHSPQAANAAMLRILDSTLGPTGVQCLLHSAMAPRIDVRFEGEAIAITEQLQQLKHIVAGDAQLSVENQPWPEPESLWRAGSSIAVGKLAVLPSQIETVCAMIQRIAKPLRLQWELLVQAIGVGLLRLDAPNQEALLTAINLLRAEIVTIEGSLVVLHCPREVKARIDVWGSAGSALPLMRRIRDHFDPKQTLNSGRYLRF